MYEKRDARVKLAELLPIVEIYYERLSKFFDRNFGFEAIPITNGLSSFNWSASLPFNSEYKFNSKPPSSYILIVTEENLNEFIKLKSEFEKEFNIAEGLTIKLTHKYFPYSEAGLYDNSLKVKLNNIGIKYSSLIKSISQYKLYKSK